ncbi:tRNA (adenosine(37)-N6)-dimethylallyltransferase MiaA [Sphingobacterium hotanense]|uniref:tRNA (adenosine(37)-N6)-dimethylallyltransferase MiaA n=1 Tax=Sphingobacterium hotanense TaxID=649196 RepID=UPI0011F10FE3|nr:tRNA (adenosine(37)-N6)-dimethylallyltransferase MiaA [Sphingobacterium hotanense]
MDKICDLKTTQDIVKYINRAKETLSPDLLLILIGPTASGKTKLAVELAKALDGEIISADSRQVYQGLDIGTGKDLKEYDGIPYHLIDIAPPTTQYSVKEFVKDFDIAYQDIIRRGKLPILCGGTGSYVQTLLQPQPYSSIPKDDTFHVEHAAFTKAELIDKIKAEEIPSDFQIDWDSHNRLIRALEIIRYLETNELPIDSANKQYPYLIMALNPSLETRRGRIDKRLSARMEEGLIPEVQGLLESGLSHDQLQWFGLEYKYASYYLLGKLTLEEFHDKLRTEIHRFAKRQMTYFRKMEKDGLAIHWLVNYR